MGLQDQLTEAILMSRSRRVASLLTRHGAQANGPDRFGTYPLYKAAVQGETAIVRILLEAGADPNQESAGDYEGTPLCAAAAWGRIKIVRLLLEYGADPDAIETANKGPMTALSWARNKEYADVIEALLAAGADPDLDPQGSALVRSEVSEDAPAPDGVVEKA